MIETVLLVHANQPVTVNRRPDEPLAASAANKVAADVQCNV